MSLKAKHILVIRFSSMGDVLLTRPVLEKFVDSYSDVRLSLLSQKNFEPYFQDGIWRNNRQINFIGADLKGQHRGVSGLWKLARTVKSEKFDVVVDLHNVFRSRLLSLFLQLPSYRINKGRDEKRDLTRRHGKILHPLKPTVERYADVFERAGYVLSVDPSTLVALKKQPAQKTHSSILRIGIAPLSRHAEKEWPLTSMRVLIQSMRQKYDSEIFLLGSPAEKPLLEDYFADIAPVIAGTMKPADEMEFLKTLDLIITMDSANLHLASLLGIPTISLWGPTHPFAGFSPIGNFHLLVQKDDLSCRPCSVFGNKPCFRKDHACMNELSPEYVFQEIGKFILKIQNSI